MGPPQAEGQAPALLLVKLRLIQRIICEMMDLSFVIVNWNTRGLLLDCLGSVYTKVKGLEFEVFVVDNGSLDGSLEAVRASFPEVRLIENEENSGFARAATRPWGRYLAVTQFCSIQMPSWRKELWRS